MAADLVNADLAPTPLAERTWNLWHIASLWVGMSVCIPSYMLGLGDDRRRRSIVGACCSSNNHIKQRRLRLDGKIGCRNNNRRNKFFHARGKESGRRVDADDAVVVFVDVVVVVLLFDGAINGGA